MKELVVWMVDSSPAKSVLKVCRISKVSTERSARHASVDDERVEVSEPSVTPHARDPTWPKTTSKSDTWTGAHYGTLFSSNSRSLNPWGRSIDAFWGVHDGLRWAPRWSILDGDDTNGGRRSQFRGLCSIARLLHAARSGCRSCAVVPTLVQGGRLSRLQHALRDCTCRLGAAKGVLYMYHMRKHTTEHIAVEVSAQARRDSTTDGGSVDYYVFIPSLARAKPATYSCLALLWSTTSTSTACFCVGLL